MLQGMLLFGGDNVPLENTSGALLDLLGKQVGSGEVLDTGVAAQGRAVPRRVHRDPDLRVLGDELGKVPQAADRLQLLLAHDAEWGGRLCQVRARVGPRDAAEERAD